MLIKDVMMNKLNSSEETLTDLGWLPDVIDIVKINRRAKCRFSGIKKN